MKPWLTILALLLAAGAAAQQKPQGPPVNVNVMNVCTPAEDEQKDIAAALARIPMQPRLAADFEIARGRTTLADAPMANWVRVRHELGANAPFTTAQYSFSVDEKGIIETLVLRAREGTDLVQVALEDKVTSGTPAAVLAANTPATRVRIERLGKPSRGLARCADTDQSAYQGLFDRASEIMTAYRKLLNVRATVGAELSRLGVGAPPKRTMNQTSGEKMKNER